MRERIIFISKEYEPVSNGTVTCLINFLPILSEKFDVVLITSRSNLKNENCVNRESINVVRVSTVFDRILLLSYEIIRNYSSKVESHLSKMMIRKFIKLIFLPIELLSKKFGFYTEYSWNKNITKFLEKNIDFTKYDIISAIGNPFSNVRSAVAIKKKFPSLRLYLFEFDLYSYNPTTYNKDSETRFSMKYEEEIEWFELAESVFITNEMNEILLKSPFRKYEKKIVPLATPTLTPLDQFEKYTINKIDKDEISLVYTGIFYKEIRNPVFMLSVILELVKLNSNIKLHIVGYGCEDTIRYYTKSSNNRIIDHGRKLKSDTIDYLKYADFLVNISNNSNSQAPSKIIEYIGTGKPIINFYTVDNDLCVNILSQYPNSISFQENDGLVKETAIKLHDFILNNLNVNNSFEIIKGIYSEYLPISFTEKVIEVISKDLNSII